MAYIQSIAMDHRSEKGHVLEADLRRALEREEFQLHYQPIVALELEQIVGFEALLRWMHPARGVLSPGEFLPAAEATNLMTPLSQGTLRQLCRQLGRWQAVLGRNAPLTVSINLSVSYLSQGSLLREVTDLASATQVQVGALRFELSDAQISSNLDLVGPIFSELKEMGMGVVIDDFGSQSISLRHLARFPICALKVDRSLIAGLPADPESRLVCQATIALGHSFGIEVIAKGVENAEQRRVLRDMECEYAQGFFFSPPHDPDAAFMLFSEKMQGNRCDLVDPARLQAFPIFAGLTPDAMQEIVQNCKELIVPPDTLIIQQGQVGGRIYLLEKGSAAICRASGETHRFLGILQAPDIVGEMAAVDPERIRTANVRSLTALRLLSLPIPAFLSSLRRFPALAKNLRQLIAGRSGE